MEKVNELVTCHWLSPTRIMPHPVWFEASARPWACMRDGYPRPLTECELAACAKCPRWEPRTFDSAKRDLVFETWGVGADGCPRATYDDARRGHLLDAWGMA
jgi:hypothetical protein